MIPASRSAGQRKLDTLHRLEHDVDGWVASADPGSGTPHLVPLSFLWDGVTLLVATPSGSRTSRNMRATGTVRIGIGGTRDVVLIEGTVEAVAADALPAEVGDAFAVKADWDPRDESDPYTFFRIRPRRIQAWREAPELKGRELMRDGVWLADD